MANFNLIAPYYDQLAKRVFGSSIQRAQVHFLKDINQNINRILIFGGGTGWILKTLSIYAPNASIIFIDASQKMCKQALKFCEKEGIKNHVEIICADETVLPTLSKFDLILTPFILDVFGEEKIKEVLMVMKALLTNDGNLIITDFDIEHTRVSFWKNGLVKVMFSFFRLTANLQTNALKNYWKYAQDIGFIEIEKAYFFHKMIKTAFLKSGIDKT